MTTSHGEQLPALARAAITASLEGAPAPFPAGEWGTPTATFVTLTIAGRLRGCIGSLAPYRPLGEDVIANARAAAFHDPRFPPLTAEELSRVRIEVSVLSIPTPLPAESRQEALEALRPGVDGIVLRADGHSATYLPQVWEQLPRPQQFLDGLLVKAGLPAGYWGPEVRLARYTVEAFKEEP